MLFLLAIRVHGLVHVVDPGLARESVHTPEAVPALAPGPGPARTRKARAAALVAVAAAVHVQDIEIMGKLFSPFCCFNHEF